MVTITVYVEGGTVPPSTEPTLAIDENSEGFRKAFHLLFSQVLSSEALNIEVVPIGTVWNAPRRWKEKISRETNGFLLVDLDGPQTERDHRIADNYSEGDSSRLFFMIQEMEAWLLSQSEVIEKFCTEEGFIRILETPFATHIILKDKHPEEIVSPNEKLDELMSRHFEVLAQRRGKPHFAKRHYRKMKDAPGLITALSFQRLTETFEDARRLREAIISRAI